MLTLLGPSSDRRAVVLACRHADLTSCQLTTPAWPPPLRSCRSITVQQLIDRVIAHPGVLAVFTYRTGQRGRITRLDEVYNGRTR